MQYNPLPFLRLDIQKNIGHQKLRWFYLHVHCKLHGGGGEGVERVNTVIFPLRLVSG